MLGKLVVRKSGEEVCGRIFWTKMWRYLCSVRMHIKVWSQKRNILIIKWIEGLTLCILVDFSLSHPCNAQWANEQTGHGGKERGYIWTQQYELPLVWANLAVTECWVHSLLTIETNIKSRCGAIPWGDQLAPWWQVDYTGLLPSWKRQHFVLTGIDTLGMDLSSPDTVQLPKQPSLDLQNALFSMMVFQRTFFF